jgi:hypothetical protein
VSEGYKIPVDWLKIPEEYEEPDNKSAKDNYEFVRSEVDRLVANRQVVECSHKLRCNNPLTVALADGKVRRRLCLDLSRCVNPSLDDDEFGMATLQDAINSVRKGDFQVAFNLKAAFYHVQLYSSMYELMGFQVKQLYGVVKYYCFVVLVFGLKVAAQVLGRVMKPVCTFLLQNENLMVLYIDDGWIVGPSKERTIARYKFALDTLKKAGLTVSIEKSCAPEDASQQMKYLGVIIDLSKMYILAPAEKIATLCPNWQNKVCLSLSQLAY